MENSPRYSPKSKQDILNNGGRHATHWDLRFLSLAKFVSGWSRDPSTKVGAVIVRPNKTVASLGFNGFPRGVVDSEERLHDKNQKYPRIVHAELNAILNCPERPAGYILYCTMAPCSNPCAASIIQSGIREVVTLLPPPNPTEEDLERIKRWEDSIAISREMFKEAGVDFFAL